MNQMQKTDSVIDINNVWNNEEDQKLMDAYNIFESQWKKISEAIPGKTEFQCIQRWEMLMNNLKISDSEIEKQEELEIKTFKTEVQCKQELQNIEPQPNKKVNIQQSEQQQNDNKVSYLCPRNFIFKFEQLFDSSQNEPKKIVWIPVPIIRITKKTSPTKQTNDQLEQTAEDLKIEEQLKPQKN